MLSLLLIQIIVDILFFVAILILLRQLNKKITQSSRTVDVSTISELKKIITDSENSANQFMTFMDDNKQQLNKFVKQLDDKERNMVMLLEEAETALQKLSSQKAKSESDAKYNQYDDVIKMAQQGMSLKEIAKRSSVTEGEISLVMELTKAKINDVD